MRKNIFKISLCLLGVAVLALSGCNLTSQIVEETWEGVEQFEAYASGTTVKTVDFDLTFVDEETYKIEMTGTWGSDTVYSTRTGSFVIDGKTITLTGTAQTDEPDEYLNELYINETWTALGIFPAEGKESESEIKKGKYLIVYTALTFTDADGTERVFTQAKD